MNDRNHFPTPPIPIIDLHCDLLACLARNADADPNNTDDLGCALPYLREGNVKLQVMAIYSPGGEAPYDLTRSQVNWFRTLVSDYSDSVTAVTTASDIEKYIRSSKIGIVAAIENSSGLCSEDEPLDLAFERLNEVIKATGRLLYISLTHHGANRFGGGNTSDRGITADGQALLEYIDGRGIAVDLSHTSDNLAHDIINHINKRNLNLRIIASHSNFRSVYDHRRNLPDELAKAIIERRGLIGMNFLRAFLHPTDPSFLIRHIEHGLKLGGRNALCFGADYFCTRDHPDRSRVPFYFKEHEHAGKYPQILGSLEGILSAEEKSGLASGNVREFVSSVSGSDS